MPSFRDNCNRKCNRASSSSSSPGLQDFLICIEMFIAAMAHAYAFPPRDYMDLNVPTKGFFTNVRYMFDLRDVVVDVSDVMEDQVWREGVRV